MDTPQCPPHLPRHHLAAEAGLVESNLVQVLGPNLLVPQISLICCPWVFGIMAAVNTSPRGMEDGDMPADPW